MSDDEIVKHYETILMSTDVYPIEMHRRLYLILKDEPDNSDWQSVSNEVYSIFAEYGNREYQGEVLYRTELVNKDGISMFFGDGSTYLPWIFVANIINAMIVDGDYPGDFTQLFEEARKILEKAEYVVSDEYLMTAVLELQKEKIYNPTALQIAEQTEAVIIRDAEDIEEEDFSAVVTAVEHSDDTEDVFAEPVEVQKKAERKPRAKQDLPSRNYRAFAKLFPDIISGKYSALMLSAGESFDPLEIYHKGGNRYSMEHYWINNGDRMYDPYMEFIIDRENQTIQAASYENSNVGLAQQVFTDEGYYPQLQKELNSFLSNWLKNISFQDYSPVRAIEIINDEEKTVTFPIEPETPQLNLFTDLTDGEQITMTDISSDDKKNVVTEESEIDENAEFKILEECTGSHHGQIDMIMNAYKGEIPVGYMQYSIFEDAPHINNIEVMPSQRRRGIATRLLQNLQGQYPTFEIVWGIIINEALCFGADGKLVEGFEMDDELVEKIKAYAAEHVVYPDAVLQNPISANNDWDRVLNAFSVCPSLKSFVMNMVNEIENYLMKIFSEQKDGKYFIPYDAFEDSTGIVDNFDNKLFVDMLLDQDNIEDVEMDEKGYWVYVAPENCVTNTAVNDENVFTDETEENLDAEL